MKSPQGEAEVPGTGGRYSQARSTDELRKPRSPARSARWAKPVGALVVVLILLLSLASIASGARDTSTMTALPTAVAGPSGASYPVTFTETGLAVGTSWGVSVNRVPESSTEATVVFEEPNGNYSFDVASLSGYTGPTPASGSLVVDGAALNVTIAFAPVTYAVTFTQTGLPIEARWWVTLAGTYEFSVSSSLSFLEANGSYAFTVGSSGYSATPSSGMVTVDAAGVNETVSFGPAPPTTYSVTFVEYGLPSGTTWSATLGRTMASSPTASIVFPATNGSYGFAIGALAGYQVAPDSGLVNVSGANVSERITFTALGTTYTVTFTEANLPTGTSWVVAFDTSPRSSTTTTIVFPGLGNGSYSYTVGLVSGYTANPSSGTVTVSGANVNQGITFTAVLTTYTVTFTETGMPTSAGGGVSFNGGPATAFTSGGTLTFMSVANGSYAYTITAGAG